MPFAIHQCVSDGMLGADVDGVDDADDDGADGGFRAREDLAGAGAFVDDEDAVADAGFDGGDGNEVGACRLAGGVEAIADEQPATVEVGVVDRGDDFAGDLSEEHWAAFNVVLGLVGAEIANRKLKNANYKLAEGGG